MLLAKDLRDSVLQAAFSGNLSVRKYTDTVLEINEIDTEKCDKGIPIFDIPDNWRYLNIEMVSSKQIRRGKSPKYTHSSSVLVFAQKCNRKIGDICLDEAKYSDEERASRYKDEEFLQDGDIVINSTGGGTLGRVGYFKNIPLQDTLRIFPDSHVTLVRANKFVNSTYLYLYLKFNQPYLESKGVGSTNQTELKPITIKKLPIPVPPIEEQQRIVDRVDELMAKINEYDKLEQQLDKLNKEFPGDMKDAVLEHAIHGKLLDFSDNHRTGNNRFLNDFECPDHWDVSEIKDVLNIKSGLTYKKTDVVTSSHEDSYRVLRGGNINTDYSYALLDNDVYVSKEPYQNKINLLKNNDIITPSVTSIQNIGKCALIHKDYDNVTAGGFIYIINVLNDKKLLPKFVLYYLSSKTHKEFSLPNIKKSGQAFYNHNKTGLMKQPIPLPPIEEQRRIVDLLDKVLPLCDELYSLV